MIGPAGTFKAPKNNETPDAESVQVEHVVSCDSPLHIMTELIRVSGDDMLITQWLIFLGWMHDQLQTQHDQINLLNTIMKAQNS